MRSLAKAIAAFIRSDGDRRAMSIPHWAETYKCGLDDVRQEFERQMSEASLKPDNSYEVEGK